MDCDLIFVYGTLRSSVRSDIHGRFLGDRAEYVGSGWIVGRLWKVSWYPAMTRGDSREERVIGDVYRLTERDQMLAELDDFEVCDLENPAESEYTRELVEVTLDVGSVITAWAYLFLGKTGNLTRIPGGDFSV